MRSSCDRRLVVNNFNLTISTSLVKKCVRDEFKQVAHYLCPAAAAAAALARRLQVSEANISALRYLILANQH
jgi:hypothetical protein